MAYRFIFYEGVTEAMVLDMEDLIGSVCYPDDTGSTAEQLEVYRKNKRSRIAVFKGDKLIGYTCVLPITDETYRMIKESVTSNVFLHLGQVMKYEAGGRYKLYIDGFAIMPEERNYELSKLLLNAVFFEIGRMAGDGIEVDEIVCYVTDRRVGRLLEIEGFIMTGDVSSRMPVYSIKKECFPAAAAVKNTFPVC